MGIEHVITCDRCKRVIDDKVEDYTSILAKLEIDHNVNPMQRDERESEHGLFCTDCSERVWNQVKTVLTFDTAVVIAAPGEVAA